MLAKKTGLLALNQPRRFFRTGVTLIELLIATALTLLVMGAVATLFGQVGDAVSGTRSTLRMSEQVRNAQNLLLTDLQGATALGGINISPTEDRGFFEYIEGPQRDKAFATTTPTSMLGDRDDGLMFTTQRLHESLSGNFGIDTSSGGTPTPPPSTTPDCTGDAPRILDLSPPGWGGPSNLGYGGNHSWIAKGSSTVATWTFSALTPGIYEVSATWVANTNRATNSPYTIVGDTSQTVQVNQRLAPSADHVAGGVNFKSLTTMQVSGDTLTVTLSAAAADNYVIADAVRIECVEALPAPPPPPAPVVSAGLSSNVAEVMWYTKVDPATGLATLYRRQLVLAPGKTLAGLPQAGFYAENDISARTTPNGLVGNTLGDLTRREYRHGRSGTFPYEFSASNVAALAGGREQDFAVLDNVVSFDVRIWDPGAPIIGSQANAGAGPAPAPTSDCTSDSPRILDLSPPGWGGPSNLGYGGNHSWIAKGSSTVATWTFSALTPGIYEVSATWVANTNRATNSPYTIVGDTSQTVQVNQRLAPSADHVAGGVNFKSLTTMQVSGDTLTVTLSAAAADNYVIADAVRIECVEALPAPPPPAPAPGSTSISPADPGYADVVAAGAKSGYGAFVDLGVYAPGYSPAGGVPRPRFNRVPNANSGLTVPTYCTWSDHYNSATWNGFDSNGNGVIDDASEAQVAAPYDAELQAIEIVIRVYEPSSRSVKQVTVRRDLSLK